MRWQSHARSKDFANGRKWAEMGSDHGLHSNMTMAPLPNTRAFNFYTPPQCVALGCQVIYFVWLDLLDDADQVRGICQVAVVHYEVAVCLVRILIEVVHALGVEERCAALDAVDAVAFPEQKFSQIGSVLACNACD